MATATYPPPPPYYRLYKDYLQDPTSAPEPPPPIEGTYICFGGNYTVRIPHLFIQKKTLSVIVLTSQSCFLVQFLVLKV